MSQRTKNDVRDLLYRTFGKEIQIIDAIVDLLVYILPQDVEGADPKNPIRCVFAQACIRMFGYPAIFWKSIAYVCQTNEKGEKQALRYKLKKQVTDMIVKFDRGEVKFPVGAAIVLSAPTSKSRFHTRRRISKKYRQTRRGQLKNRESTARRNFRNAEARFEAITEQYKELAQKEKPLSPKMQSMIKRRKEAKESVLMAKAHLETVEQNVKQARIPRSLRKPSVFDLTTRNGAVGNYHFS